MSTETPGTDEMASKEGEEIRAAEVTTEAGASPAITSVEQIMEEESLNGLTTKKTVTEFKSFPGDGGSKEREQEEEEKEQEEENNMKEQTYSSGATTPTGPPPSAAASTAAAEPGGESSRKYEINRNSSIGESRGEGEAEFEDYSEDDTEVSSEAVVDDIELILMPEEVEDLPPMENAPKLVRVTELSIAEFTEEEFLKMDDTEDQGNYDDGAGDRYSGDEQTEEEEEEDEGDEERTENERRRSRQKLSRGDYYSQSFSSSGEKVHSGVQTDISALEKDDEDGGAEDEDDSCFSEGQTKLDWRRRKTLTLTGVGMGAGGNATYCNSARLSSGGGRLTGRSGKKLNWKSELTLLPSKTKIGFPSAGQMSMDGSNGMGGGFGAYNYASTSYSIDSNYPPDQYSSRVAKFTSQENMTSSGSQFLKPSTLYRTRNLSRNLNHFASSETTFMQDQPDSPRFQASTTALPTSSANFKGSTSVSSNQICMTTTALSSRSEFRRRPSAKSFRQSLPDLTAPVYYQDNKRRQTLTSARSTAGGGKLSHGQQAYSMGYRGQKRSSSDDETSSLIDESERCLRSSIDLLLTDDYPSPGYDYPYLPRSSGAGGSRTPGQQYTSGLYSARRSCSQPLLTDQGLIGEPRDSSMGSPFLPRTLKDMRCSRFAKVILPNGLVAVVCVKEMDEVRDSLTVNTETGCILTIPFRKVVFAWRLKR